MIYLFDFFSYFFSTFFALWWIILPVLIFCIVGQKFLVTRRYLANGKREWVFLEIQIPPDVERTPRAMEEVFNSLHALNRNGNWYNIYINGFTPPFIVLELICHNGTLRFIIRCEDIMQELIKSRIYSQYPEAKVEEVPDPLKDLPEKVPEQTFDIFGTGYEFTKEDAYPLRTYEAWDKLPEEQRIDPVSILSEGAAQFTDREWGIIQIFAMPVAANHEKWGENWEKKGREVVDKLIGRKKANEPGPWDEIAEFIKNLFLFWWREPVWKEQKKDEEVGKTLMQHLSPGERDIVEQVERKLSKNGYWSVVRVAYIGRKDIFSQNMPRHWVLINSFLRIFSTQNLNGLKPNGKMITVIDEPTSFLKERLFYRKRFLYAVIKFFFGPVRDKRIILNSEELASLFHVPLGFVPAPGIERRIFSEKAPPADVPTIEWLL